jgi:hypothetical protein
LMIVAGAKDKAKALKRLNRRRRRSPLEKCLNFSQEWQMKAAQSAAFICHSCDLIKKRFFYDAALLHHKKIASLGYCASLATPFFLIS